MTIAFSPSVNFAVLAAPAAVETELPMPSASDDENASMQQHAGVVLEQALLGFLAPHHARTDDRDQRGDVPTVGFGVERAQHRLGERVADDGDDVDALALDGVEQLVGRVGAAASG